MKLLEMQQECRKNKGKCKNCKLNCVYDWDIIQETWCLMSLRQKYENKYRMHMERNEPQKAQETMKEYVSIEQKYLTSGKKGCEK